MLLQDLLVPGQQEWNELVLIWKIMFAHDADEVLKLRLWSTPAEDFLAWQ